MKRSIAFLLLAFAAATAHAGSFGGPPPFTNGSPLTTGVNGSYQASARGSNLSGVITFKYSAGVQTAVSTENRWVIFYQGQVFTGTTDAAINDGSIAGVLETATTGPVDRTTTWSSTTATTIPAASADRSTSSTLASISNPAGFFSATLNNNSPTGTFKGTGVLSGIFTTTTTSTATIVDPTTGTSTSDTATTSTQQISASFKVKGVRATTGT